MGQTILKFYLLYCQIKIIFKIYVLGLKFILIYVSINNVQFTIKYEILEDIFLIIMQFYY